MNRRALPSHGGIETVDRSRTAVWVALLLAAVLSLAIIAALFLVPVRPASPPSNTNEPPPTSMCPRSVGLCVEGRVVKVVDGDTLELESGLKVRLVLVDAPELSESGGSEARDYLTQLCLGSMALVDEDDFQIGDDPYGRTLAVVYCGGVNANAALISAGLADTYHAYCSESEFGGEAWTGCASPPPPAENCDPAYPDVCIPPPPPDLDCGDITHRRFQVLAPDPHHFDSDGDGVGCESG